MKSTVDILEERISAAMARAAGQTGCAAVVRPATDPRFGDYQANGVMGLAKQLKTPPRKLAESVVALLDLGDLCEPPEVAGPGFINLRLKPQYVASELLRIADEDGERLGIQETASPQTVVVDFSSPNVAKQMHVGHLRSTIIGDCLCRLLEFEGHKVIRQNHIGDWGTQFGMLIRYIIEHRAPAVAGEAPRDLHKDLSVADMEELYRKAKQRYDHDPQFAQESRDWVVKLQTGDSDALALWQSIVHASLGE